jgi:ribonuclease T1
MNAPRRRRTNPAILIAALIAVAITTFWNRSDERSQPAPAGVERRTAATSSRPAPAPAPPVASPRSAENPALDSVVESRDEREALARTLALIESNGPFPYPGKDGSTFSNREGKLPKRPRGYYREYTVPTAGAGNRGARRVVTGSEGERWYTRDHYRTFTRVDAAAPVR